MKARIAMAALFAAVLGLIIYGGTRWPPRTSGRVAEQEALSRAAHWRPETGRLVRLMIEKYGPPRQVSDDRVVWGRRGPWKRIEVDGRDPKRPLEQVVDYAVPAARRDELLRFGHGLTVAAPDQDELGARGPSERRNILALNLAHDIATGRRTAEQARRFYAQTVRLEASGKSSPYLEKLLFPMPLPSREYYPYTRPPF